MGKKFQNVHLFQNIINVDITFNNNFSPTLTESKIQ